MDENPFLHGPLLWLLYIYLGITLGGALLLVIYSSVSFYLERSPTWKRVKDDPRWPRRKKKSAWSN